MHGLGLAAAVLIQAWASQWMDMVSIYICPFGAMLAGVMFFYVMRKQTALDAVNLGAKSPSEAGSCPSAAMYTSRCA